jgi:hypothetical protein
VQRLVLETQWGIANGLAENSAVIGACEHIGKTMPVTGRGGPQACETSRFPLCLDSRLRDGGEFFSVTSSPGRFLVLIYVSD